VRRATLQGAARIAGAVAAVALAWQAPSVCRANEPRETRAASAEPGPTARPVLRKAVPPARASRRLRVEKISVDLPLSLGQQRTIARGCNAGETIEALALDPLEIGAGFEAALYTMAESRGYDRPTVAHAPGYTSPASFAELSLAGSIEDVDIEYCLSGTATVASRVRVVWTTFDNLARRVVHTATTEGTHRGERIGLDEANARALLAAARGLYADRTFLALLEPRRPARVDLTPKIALGRTGDVRESPDLEVLRTHAVTVRNPVHHGTGVLIGPRHVLTASDAVLHSDEVSIVLEGETLAGFVVSRAESPDVALVQLERPARSPIPRSGDAGALDAGDQITVVGTPPDASAERALRRLIVSGPVSRSARRYLAAVTRITPSQYGAPAFDEAGGLVGILVPVAGEPDTLALFAHVDDALAALGLTRTSGRERGTSSGAP
jgi:hypothetical protein